MPDRLMVCSELQIRMQNHNPALFGRDARLNLRRVGASARPQPAPAPKPLDAWFFEAAGVGMHLPSPSWLVASRRLNRRRKRGGLSFGAQGGPGLRLGAAGRLCACGSRGWIVQRGTRVGTGTDYTTNSMGAHVCPSCGEKTRHGRQVMSEYGSYVTNVRA